MVQDQGPDLLHVLWGLQTLVGGFVVKFLRDLAHSVNKLSEHIAVLVERVDTHEQELKDHETRIRKVELD